MKIGGAEGTPAEIKEFLENNGLDVKKYFADYKEAGNWTIAVPCIINLATAIAILYFRKNSIDGTDYLIIAGLATIVWMACVVQTRFRSLTSTIVVAIGAILILLVANGVMRAADLPEKVKSLSESK